ncbi:hypothetical protein F5884DRAFT_393745 [Xylogone sp. PMI_703]|nr:hypothetical protein F5884DRAFT_393745 [Xylogone sp. PMI_703]
MEKESLPFVKDDATSLSQGRVEIVETRERSRLKPGARRFLAAFTLCSVILWGGLKTGCVPSRYMGTSAVTTAKLAPLEAHIMSKCPDARDCLKLLVLPTMQRVHDKVNFTLSYIGTPTDNDGVSCMHGAQECAGNIIELCASHIYPDPKIYLGFTMCLSKDYQDIPDRSLVEDCALEHGMDFEQLNECMVREDGGFGVGMLRDSVRRSSEVCFVLTQAK